MINRTLPAALLATIAAAPLAAQTFVSPQCPQGSLRVGNECRAANGTVVQRFAIPQIEQDNSVQVYDLTSDSPYAEGARGTGERVVIRKNSTFVTDLDTDFTVIAD
ncbi:hypothetical protein FHY55_13355 [Oceanicola sp. D3]|uniref:hypothetical protein n=1 Tax=Oceanicola sp. D3 TaxID=2587163 RepID=UPI0011224260|nr:hypothetical protein [Oceanicola sp. D3]QDC10173.1 hypothetical protein FHY55_13355 [Oceanicola sp. D3]